MSDITPTRVVSLIDSIQAPVGRSYVELRSTLVFLNTADRDAFVATLGLAGGGGGGGGIDTSLSAFTGTGGLENVGTTLLPVNTSYRRFYVTGSGLVDFRLVAGTDTPVAGEKVRGTDYNASTNAKFWLRV